MSDAAGNAQVFQRANLPVGIAAQIDDEQFAAWTRLLRQKAGLFIAPERRSFLLSGIRARMRATQCASVGEYYDRLIQCDNAAEWPLLIDRLTVHETCFFRHESSLRFVGSCVLPDVLKQSGEFTVWSVGCATGEETYSLAMLIDDGLEGEPAPASWRIVGSDISEPALKCAREGRYLRRRLRDIPLAYQFKYCEQVSGTHFRISDGIRQRVTFTSLNLSTQAAAGKQDFDLIYCQNLLIYYDRQSRLDMVDWLARNLRPGGVMILGPGELLDWPNANMEKVRYPDSLVYRRIN